VLDKILFRFAICLSIPEIFAIKVESCQKSRRILDVYFALANFRGQAFEKLYEFYHRCLAARRLEKFRENTPTGPEVIGANTLNFRPNFKFSGLNFSGGTPVSFGVCASKAWSNSNMCKNFMVQHPLGAEI